MGRIDGISIANAQGPMQFLPTTWTERGIGRGGNIKDPHDAIQAAARYLVRRGGKRDKCPCNIVKALWGYNNNYAYGRAVLHYRDLIKEDPAAYLGIYHWEGWPPPPPPPPPHPPPPPGACRNQQRRPLARLRVWGRAQESDAGGRLPPNPPLPAPYPLNISPP